MFIKFYMCQKGFEIKNERLVNHKKLFKMFTNTLDLIIMIIIKKIPCCMSGSLIMHHIYFQRLSNAAHKMTQQCTDVI
jgi:hypothetical protein